MTSVALDPRSFRPLTDRLLTALHFVAVNDGYLVKKREAVALERYGYVEVTYLHRDHSLRNRWRVQLTDRGRAYLNTNTSAVARWGKVSE